MNIYALSLVIEFSVPLLPLSESLSLCDQLSMSLSLHRSPTWISTLSLLGSFIDLTFTFLPLTDPGRHHNGLALHIQQISWKGLSSIV